MDVASSECGGERVAVALPFLSRPPPTVAAVVNRIAVRMRVADRGRRIARAGSHRLRSRTGLLHEDPPRCRSRVPFGIGLALQRADGEGVAVIDFGLLEPCGAPGCREML